jgi:hypothetical protein
VDGEITGGLTVFIANHSYHVLRINIPDQGKESPVKVDFPSAIKKLVEKLSDS